jgi:hypothetical protein
MSPNERIPQSHRPEPYPAESARQGEIVLRARWQRLIFIAALVACVVLVLALRLIAAWS